jgi:ATP-dependent Clp protease protease subunit
MFFGFKHIIYIIALVSSFKNVECFNINNLLNRRIFLTNTLASNGLINLNANANNKKIILLNDGNDHNNEDNNGNNINYESLKILQRNNNNRVNNNIYFTGGLNDETCFKLTEALMHHRNQALSNDKYPPYINLFIQSPGGSLLPTLAVVDEIKNLGIPVYTYIRGYAASAATLLSVAGTQRFMYKHSLAMIHGVKLQEQEVSSLTDIKDLNANVDTFMNVVKDIYLENTSMDEQLLEYFFYHDLWMNSTQALDYGLIDEII